MPEHHRAERVLVTGASGFIGRALVAALRADGVQVVGVDLQPSPVPDVEHVQGNLENPAVVAAALASRPEAVFHLAARTSVLRSVEDPDGVYRTNVAVTQALLEAARAAGTRSFVLASTNAVVGPSDGTPIDENTPLRPLTPYGATKAAGEMLASAYAASYGLACCAVRMTNVYGHGMGAKDTFVVRLLRAAASRRPATVYGDGEQERDYVYVDDAVQGLRLASDRLLTGPLVIGSGRSWSVLDVCELARQATALPLDVVHVEGPAGEMRAVRVDISYARSVGYEPAVVLPDGLAQTWTALQPELGSGGGAGPSV